MSTSKRKQERGRVYDIKEWNEMKKKLKNDLLMESTKDAEFINNLVLISKLFDTRWRAEDGPFSDEVMKKKIEDHYKRMGKNVYNRISAAIKNLKTKVTQRDIEQDILEAKEA